MTVTELTDTSPVTDLTSPS